MDSFQRCMQSSQQKCAAVGSVELRSATTCVKADWHTGQRGPATRAIAIMVTRTLSAAVDMHCPVLNTGPASSIGHALTCRIEPVERLNERVGFASDALDQIVVLWRVHLNGL